MDPETRNCKSSLKRGKPVSKRIAGHTYIDTYIPILFGPTCINGTILNDMNTKEKCLFFVFHDLSVRIQGEFCMRIQIIDMEKYVFSFFQFSLTPILLETVP